MTNATVKLAAPPGAAGVFVGGEDYRVDNGVVEVPAEYAAALKASFGYSDYVPEVKTAKPSKASRDGSI